MIIFAYVILKCLFGKTFRTILRIFYQYRPRFHTETRRAPSGRWHISIRFDDPTIKPLPVTDKAIGIDLGISSLVSTSDGDKVSNPKHFKKHYQRLRKAQKNLSRKQKDSKNREKAKIKVAKIHAQITDSRKDHLYKLTTQLVRENQTILVENLAVKNMVKNPKLSQAISDVSWGEITRQLAYKWEHLTFAMSINT